MVPHSKTDTPIVFARVASIADDHIFFELREGRQGVIRYEDTSFSRTSRFRHSFIIGKEMEVGVLSEEPGGLVRLALVQRCEPPWEHAEEAYPVGKIVPGRVVAHGATGTLVELEAGIGALVPRDAHSALDAVPAVGALVECVVIEVDVSRERVLLAWRT